MKSVIFRNDNQVGVAALRKTWMAARLITNGKLSFKEYHERFGRSRRQFKRDVSHLSLIGIYYSAPWGRDSQDPDKAGVISFVGFNPEYREKAAA